MVKDRMWLGCVMLAMGSTIGAVFIWRTYCALCTQDEWNWTPSKRIEDDEKVDADNGESRIAVKCLAFDDWVYGLVNSLKVVSCGR